MQAAEDIQFDRFGRMKYHPDFHLKHGETFTESDLEYLCKFWEFDHMRMISFALEKTEHTCAAKVAQLRKEGKFEYYKNLNKYW